MSRYLKSMKESCCKVVKMSVVNSRSANEVKDEGRRAAVEGIKKPLLLSLFSFSVSEFKADKYEREHEYRDKSSSGKKINIGELIKSSLHQKVSELDVNKYDNSELGKQKKLLRNLILKLEQDLKQLQKANEAVEKVENEVEFLRKVVSKSEYEDLSSVEKCLDEKKQLLSIIDYLCKKNIYLILLIREILIHYLEMLSKDRGELILELFQRKKRLIKMLSYALRFGIPFALQKLPVF